MNKIALVFFNIILVQAAFSQTLQVFAPNGGETYKGGEKVYITWQTSTGISKVRIEYSLNNSGNWYQLSSGNTSKSFRWVVPYIKKTSLQALVRITAEGITNPPSDVSDAPFTIAAAAPDPYEPNNTLGTAYQTTINDTLWGAMTMVSTAGSADTSGLDIDFYKFTLDKGALLVLKTLPDFRDTLDTNTILINYNDRGSEPILTLYNSSGENLIHGYGSITYNASTSGVYYCRVDSCYNGYSTWHKYGFLIDTANAGSVNILSPNGGGTYTGGQKVYITWQTSTGISKVRIDYSLNNGGGWYRLSSENTSKSFRWVVPYIKKTSSQALIRITAEDITNPPSDVSDAPFTITAAAPDPYEPNNTLATAYQTTINDTLWGAMTMVSTAGSIDTSGLDIDFYKFTLNNGALIVLKTLPDFRDTIDTNTIQIKYNDVGSEPILTLYNSLGENLIHGYGSITYNASTSGIYYCRVDSSYNSYSTWHKYGFLVDTANAGSVNILSPNGGGTYTGGQKVYITWQTSTGISKVRIDYSLNNGGGWYRLSSENTSKSFRWVVPYIKKTSSQALIRITAEDITNPPSDVSDAPFTITAAAPDPYEPNNTLATAYQTTINDTLWGAMTMVSTAGSIDTSGLDIDFYKFTLNNGALIVLKTLPDFKDTIDTNTILIKYNNVGSEPILTLYNSIGENLIYGYGSITYNTLTNGIFYCRVDSSYNGCCTWHKYGFSACAIPWKDVDKIDIDELDFTMMVDTGGDTLYAVQMTGQNTKLNINLALNLKKQGTVVAGILDTNKVFTTPDSLIQVKMISIDAPVDFDTMLKYAEIVIPYKESELGNLPEKTLGIYYKQTVTTEEKKETGNDWKYSDQWIPVSSVHDSINNTFIVKIKSLYILGLFSVKSSVGINDKQLISSNCTNMHFECITRNGFITIHYKIPKDGSIALEVFNSHGKKLYKIANTLCKAGCYTIRWDASKLSAGIYYFKLSAVNSSVIKRAVVLK